MPVFHSLAVREVRRETQDAVSVAFDVPQHLSEDFQFIQGQYLTLKADINGEEVRRNYSVCVSPLDEELRVAIKLVPGGRFSTYANKVLKAGDEIEVMTPMGKFYTEIKTGQAKSYVGFAGGSGITPIISILKTVLKVESDSTFTLFYGNRGFDSIIFKEELEALKNTFLGRLSIHHIFSEEQLESDLFNGFITEDKCLQFAQRLFDPQLVDEYFICGPEPMMLAIRSALRQLKAPEKSIHVELFGSPGKAKAAPKAAARPDFDPDKESKIQIILDGQAFNMQLQYGGETILDAALKRGADLPFACKGGVCCTCRARLVEGDVEMDVNYALEEEEVEAGFILTCQAHPRTSQLVVDFDDQ
ncbi:MAG: 1,2-phenylacetyl-CoA epoxidase subunit PaaE [Bacteroidota bacterium]